jgi:hypothetical protein
VFSGCTPGSWLGIVPRHLLHLIVWRRHYAWVGILTHLAGRVKEGTHFLLQEWMRLIAQQTAGCVPRSWGSTITSRCQHCQARGLVLIHCRPAALHAHFAHCAVASDGTFCNTLQSQ